MRPNQQNKPSFFARPFHTPVLLTGLLTLAVSCGGGGGGSGATGGGGGGGGGGGTAGLEGTLGDLGVNLTESPRQGAGSLDLGADYTPFGETWELAKTSELLIIGPTVQSTNTKATLLDLTDENGNAAEENLLTLDPATHEWIDGDLATGSDRPNDRRSITSGDVDGDGLEEIVVLFMDGDEMHLTTIQDEDEGFAKTTVQIAFELDVDDVVVKAGKFNGDRLADLAIGFTQNRNNATLMMFESTGSDWNEVGTRKAFTSVVTSPWVSLDLSVGNVDMDAPEELLVVVNEHFGPDVNPDGLSRFALYDDLTANMATLVDLSNTSGPDQDSMNRIGLNATPLLVDVDGDDRCETILATRTDFNPNCESDGYFLMGFEDPIEGGTSMGHLYFRHRFDDCDNPMQPRIRQLQANAMDLDGDGLDEFHVNQFVFDDFINTRPWTRPSAFELPDEVIWSINHTGLFTRNTASMVTADFTGDGRDDLAVYRQDYRYVDVWGMDATDVTIERKRHIPVNSSNSGQAFFPLLVAANVDTDSPILSYSDGEYKYVFTQPIVLAAIAAAPSEVGIGQNLGGCYTAFGNTNSTGSESERSVTLKASARAGVNFNGGVLTQSAATMQAEVGFATSQLFNSAYKEERTVLYTTGSTEDTVIFTTIPMDQYTYTIQSHPDPDLIGTEVIVTLPRNPVTLQAERNFYNSALEEGAMHIDESVFTHTVGDISSYPSASQKTNLLISHGGGLSHGPQQVGQGLTGATELTLVVGNEWGVGESLEKNFEMDVEVTAGGVLAGLTFGAEESDTVRITSGSSTTYTGSVGTLDAANHADHAFQFGIFTYVQTDPTTGQDFEVVQYWVQ
ncbi:MAG: hypothetical protein P1V35_08820 [Planctomycetota bacterium]|nr:hypothetical protein [Planctomycetota bacterium]